MSNEIPYNKVFTCKVIKLQAPNGEYIPFEYLDRIEYEGGFYAVLRQIENPDGKDFSGKVSSNQLDFLAWAK